MHDPEKSDSVIVAAKLANKAERSVAEPVEPRTETKGNANQQRMRRAQDRESVSQALERVRLAARRRKKEKFTALLHHVDPEMLRTSFYALKRDAAPGVDGMTWETYEQGLDQRIETLHTRVQSGAYRAQPSRRSYIPKEDGTKRPLAVTALEDKIVQRAVAAVLNEIYEADFLGFSYGFRPGRGQHDALDALYVGICSKKVSFILDADIRSFFTEVSQEWVVRFLEHQIGDKRILRLIQKWLRAGVLEDEIVTIEEKGTGQGSVISPILSNLFLHYTFDLWMRRTHPDLPWCRYADDGLVHCRTVQEAEALRDELQARLAECHLELHPTKTKIVYCRDERRREPYPNVTFDFLGYCFRPRAVWGSRSGRLFCGYTPAVSPSALKAMREKIRDLNIRRQTQLSLDEIAEQLNPLLQGWIRYYGRFAPSALHPVLRYVNQTLLAWATRKFKRFSAHKIRASQFLQRLTRENAKLFIHWRLGLTSTFA